MRWIGTNFPSDLNAGTVGSLGYPFTLNNTAVASPRILIPILENHQNADGSITLPSALRPYMLGRAKLGA